MDAVEDLLQRTAEFAQMGPVAPRNLPMVNSRKRHPLRLPPTGKP